jgi:hypothetical protein
MFNSRQEKTKVQELCNVYFSEIGSVHADIVLCNTTPHRLVIIFLMVQQPLAGQGLLNIEASRSHSDSVGLLWTSDQPVAETSV